MAKTSEDYAKVYTGFFVTTDFNRNTQDRTEPSDNYSHHRKRSDKISELSNLSIIKKEKRVYVSYENTLYSANDIDALALVLDHTVKQYPSSELIYMTVKKSDIPQYTLRVDTKAYQTFLLTGQKTPELMQQVRLNHLNTPATHSDRFKPLFKVSPSFILVDGSEYGHMDYTLSADFSLSMRFAKGLTGTMQAFVPLSMSENFDLYGIFDYRNRNKVEADIDQLFLSQYFASDLDNVRWMNVVQAGLFDYELYGASWHTAVIDNSGKHLAMMKLSYLQDDLYRVIDRYSNTDKRKELLVSYRYYCETLHSDFKLTAGEFLYGDQGVSASMKRYFGDMHIKFDLAYTEHDLRGKNNVVKIAFTIPLFSKRYKSKHFDIAAGNFVYERRKTIVNAGKNYAQPLHLKELDNDYTLENYYLDEGRNHPAYIQSNLDRLRNFSY
ncbi:MAG TPA: hypothetical protein ENK72_01865 [Epsilonproteobacteria bacterium]|nr:hypothetical protein [Campylobacterota bacterium]